MGHQTTFIKLDRSIVTWRWYKEANTVRLFIHCLLSSNIKDHAFEDIVVPRGSFVTSYGRLAEALGLSADQVRTALKHLKETGEVTVERRRRFQIVAVTNYDRYQSQAMGEWQSDPSQIPFISQQSKKEKNEKNEKNERGAHARGKAESFDASEFFLAAVAVSLADGKGEAHDKK